MCSVSSCHGLHSIARMSVTILMCLVFGYHAHLVLLHDLGVSIDRCACHYSCPFASVGVVPYSILPNSICPIIGCTLDLVYGGYDFASNGHAYVISSQVFNGYSPCTNNPCDLSHNGGKP